MRAERETARFGRTVYWGTIKRILVSACFLGGAITAGSQGRKTC
jgi:hypothetical protein